MEKILKIVDGQCNRYMKMLVDSKGDKHDWVKRYCYRCDIGAKILCCDQCGSFQFKGYFKELGKGI